MIVKQLNGELLELEFDTPHQTIFDICKRVWDFQKIEFEKESIVLEEKREKSEKKYYNHFVFENEKGDKKITISEFHPFFDFNKDEYFVNHNRGHGLRKKGHDRQIDTSIFSLCHALFLPKKEQILVYCVGKNKFRCIDLHDFTFHVDASLVKVRDPLDPFACPWVAPGGKVVENDQIRAIDYDSIFSCYPNKFKGGSRMFQDSGTKIEHYLGRFINGFQPTYLARDGSMRGGYNHKNIIEYC